MQQDCGAKICEIIAKTIPVKPGNEVIKPTHSLHGDLGIDSITFMSIVFLLEEEFDIDLFDFSSELTDAEVIADVISIVSSVVESQA